MKLERTLIELTTMVDYGTLFFKEREAMKDGFVYIADIKEYYDIGDIYDEDYILQYVRCSFTPSDLVYDDDMIQYVRDNYDPTDVYTDEDLEEWADEIAADKIRGMCLSDFLDTNGMTEDDALYSLTDGAIIDYVRDHFNADSIYDINEYINNEYDTDQFLDTLSVEYLQNYISSNYDVSDFVDWA